MEKRFLKFLLFGVFTLVFSIAFTGCGDDYDDAGLNTKIDQLQKAYDDLKAAAITSDKLDASVSTAVSTAKTELEGKMKDLIAAQMTNGGTEADLAALTEILAQLKVLADYFPDTRYAGAMAAVEGATGDAAVRADKTPAWVQAILDCTEAVKRLDLQMAVLKMKDDGEGGYTSDIITGIEAEMARLNGLIGTGGELNEAALVTMINNYLTEHYKTTIDKIAAEIKSISPESLIIVKNIDKMITGIALVETTKGAGYGVSFGSATVLTASYTFGPEDCENPITFTKDASTSGKQSLVVRVTPAGAVLTSEMISLVNSEGNDNIGTYVRVKDVQEYKGPITRSALTSAGLYEIFFELDAAAITANEADFKTATIADANSGNPIYNAFSVAVQTNENRHVLTDFEVTFAKADVNSVYAYTGYVDNFKFSVKGTEVSSIKGGAIEKVWANNDPGKNVDKTKETVDGKDIRTSAEANLPVKIGEAFTVKMDEVMSLTPVIRNACAYYIDFDLSNATTAQKALWNNARSNISGLNKVYGINETATLTINDSNLKGVTVGFRVFAVNYDGTFVDPDGRSFYVVCDEGAVSGDPLAFETKADEITQYVSNSSSCTVKTNTKEIPYMATLANRNTVSRISVNISLEGAILYSASYSYNNNGLYSPTGKIGNFDLSFGTADADKNKMTIKDIVPSDMKEDKTYEGTLSLRNADDALLAEYKITLKKNLPTGFPKDFWKDDNMMSKPTGTTYNKAGSISYAQVDKAAKKLIVMPAPESVASGKKLSKVLFEYVPGGLSDELFANTSLSSAGLTAGTTSADLSTIELGNGYSSDASIRLEYNYGKVLYGGSEDYKVSIDNSVQVESFLAGYKLQNKGGSAVAASNIDAALVLGSGDPYIRVALKDLQLQSFYGNTTIDFNKSFFDTYIAASSSEATLTYWDELLKPVSGALVLGFDGTNPSFNIPGAIFTELLRQYNASTSTTKLGKLDVSLSVELCDLLGAKKKMLEQKMTLTMADDSNGGRTISVTLK